MPRIALSPQPVNVNFTLDAIVFTAYSSDMEKKRTNRTYSFEREDIALISRIKDYLAETHGNLTDATVIRWALRKAALASGITKPIKRA